jgi:hypothetical protein
MNNEIERATELLKKQCDCCEGRGAIHTSEGIGSTCTDCYVNLILVNLRLKTHELPDQSKP